MKTFSVSFFKRLILIVLALLILIPTVLAVVFGLRCSSLEKQIAGLESAAPGAPDYSALLGPDQAEGLAYQELFPDLYGETAIPANREPADQTVYLTFDGSPSPNTLDILDTLDDHGVKATFFVSGQTDEDSLTILKEIASRGHAIGLRSYSLSYREVYNSVEDYLADFQKIYDLVYETTGQKVQIFRFPGGSINSYNSNIYQELIAEMLRRSFVFFDWSVSGESTQSGQTADQIQANVLDGMADKSRGIVMLQDSFGKENVAKALGGIIEGLRSEGYKFQPLTTAVLPVVFSYKSAP